MIHLTSGIGLVLEVGLAVFCFVDVPLQREGRVRPLPRYAWALGILVFPILACIAHLVATRARRAVAAAQADQASGPAPTATPAPLVLTPRRLNDEHEEMLSRWEDDLRTRELKLRVAHSTGADLDDLADLDKPAA